ncbi:MAG: T9SS type A sorting domain-containing protein [Saprospiraceae bacterium]|nr:T9SS type A sorting domain-containing protein [Saprospiraceae bacterium]
MKNTISILLFLFTTVLGFSQGWEQLYETNLMRDNFLKAIQLPDGDYLILGDSSNFFPPIRTITRTNELGIEKWHRPLPGISAFSKMFLLPSGNIDLVSSGQILKIDTAATILNPEETDLIGLFSQNIIQSSDGYVSLHNNGAGALSIRKVDLDGLPIWYRTVYVDTFLLGQAVATADGGFLYAAANPPDAISLVKFDANGNQQWTTDTYLPQVQNVIVKVIATSDGGYATLAYGGIHNRILKLDAAGAQLWSKELDMLPQLGARFISVSEFIETTDGGLAFAGYIHNLLPAIYNPNPGVLKLNNSGDFEFLYTSQYQGTLKSIMQSSDGNFHLVGRAVPMPVGSYNLDTPAFAYVLKLQANGTLYSSLLQGQVVFDENQDCSVSAGEMPLGGWIVRATTGTFDFFDVTDDNGRYSIAVSPGAYTLEVLEQNNLWSACENPIVFNFSSEGDTISNDFLLQAVVNCPAMQVDIGTPFLRRCFDNALYVQYCNLGTVTAENAFIEVTLDSLMTIQSSTIPHSGQTGNTYTFPVGNVGIGECGSFSILAYVSCNTALNQTLCMEAHAFPDSICGVSFNWSGASMVARAQCEGDSIVVLELENIGTAPTSEPIDYIVIEDQIIFLQGSEVFEPGQLSTVEQPANGATWRISSEQEPNHPGNSFPTAFVEGCGLNSMHMFSTGFANEFPQNDGELSIDIDCEQVIGAYDPNDKMGLPKGYGAQHYIEPNTDLEYRIRFQNTGTDTAFTVVIRDTLSPFLDPASIKVGASSHNYEFDMEGDAVAIFRFDNILLPDSNINEALSHGFVSFSISQKPDVALESVIENEAAIYFDFNDPVITNPVFHTIGINFIEVATDVTELPEGLGELLAYPNPSAGEVTFEIPTEQPVSATFVLYDSFGRLAMRKGFEGQRFLFNGNELPKGIYFYKVEVEGLGKYSGKVILK